MKVWNSFPMVRLVLPFLAGIISWAFLFEHIKFNVLYLAVLAGLTFTFWIVLFLVRNQGRKPYLYGIVLAPLLFLIGILLAASVSSPIYSEFLHGQSAEESENAYLAEILDEPQVKGNSIKVIAELTDLRLEEHGKVLLYFENDSLSTQLKYGNEILIRTQIQPVKNLGNPNEFNYARYLRFHDIYFRGYVKNENWEKLSDGTLGIQGRFLNLRSKLVGMLQKAGLSGNELSVASALILGFRTDLDKELMNAYAGAGATHVLAVSGLHVGIVYVILSGLLKFLDRLKYGRIVKILLLVLLLFSYAALTGLSSSVFRAATMFSFVAIGKLIKRDTNIFNTLAASAFCLTLYDPMIIMQVGFQLSYAAVLGIVLIQPRLFELWASENRMVDWAWSITCVSIAAQIATFPLGLLYFHQFPNLFLVSNLLVIPAAVVILYLGFTLFVVSFWQPTLLFLGFLLEKVISILNLLVIWIERIPYSVLSGIDISTIETLMIYALITFLLVFVIQKQQYALYAGLALTLILVGMQIAETHQQKSQEFATVYNVKNETAVALIKGTHVTLIGSRQFWSNEQALLFHVRHHWWKSGIEKERFIELNDSLINRKLEWGNKTFAILSLTEERNVQLELDPTIKLDHVIVDLADWKYHNRLSSLNTNSMILSNRFGKSALKRIQETAGEKEVISISQIGSLSIVTE